MNKLYEFMRVVDVIVIFSIIYGFAISGIACAVCDFTRFIVKKVKAFITKYKRNRLHR